MTFEQIKPYLLKLRTGLNSIKVGGVVSVASMDNWSVKCWTPFAGKGELAWLWLPNATENAKLVRFVVQEWSNHMPQVASDFDWYSIRTSTPKGYATLWWRYLTELLAFSTLRFSPYWADTKTSARSMLEYCNRIASESRLWKPWDIGDNYSDDWVDYWMACYWSATMAIESAFNPFARYPYGANGVNSTAVGLGQVVNSTAKGLNIDAAGLAKFATDTVGLGRVYTSKDIGDALTKHRGSTSQFAPGLPYATSLLTDAVKSMVCLNQKIKSIHSKMKSKGPDAALKITGLKVANPDSFDIATVMVRYAYWGGLVYPRISQPRIEGQQREVKQSETRDVVNRIITRVYSDKPQNSSRAICGISYPNNR